MACAPQGAEVGEGGGDVVNYRVATIEGVGTPMDNAFKKFIDEVKTCSDGTLVGTNYPAGQLGGFVDLIDGNRQGTYEISMGGFDVEGAKSPKLAALSMGYVFESEEHVERAIDEMLGEFSDELRRTTGVAIIGMGEDGWRWTFANKPVRTINDLRGLKIRVPEAEIPLGLWRALGASATPVPFTEIYNALETGVIGAGEGAAAQIKANAFWEPAPNLTNTRHWFNIKPVRVNAKWLDGLTAKQQECLSTTGKTVFAEARKTSRETEAATLKEMEAKGAKVLDSPSDLPEWKKRAATYEAEYTKKYEGTEDFLKSVRALAEQ